MRLWYSAHTISDIFYFVMVGGIYGTRYALQKSHDVNIEALVVLYFGLHVLLTVIDLIYTTYTNIRNNPANSVPPEDATTLQEFEEFLEQRRIQPTLDDTATRELGEHGYTDTDTIYGIETGRDIESYS